MDAQNYYTNNDTGNTIFELKRLSSTNKKLVFVDTLIKAMKKITCYCIQHSYLFKKKKKYT
jgi:hypothetical protein